MHKETEKSGHAVSWVYALNSVLVVTGRKEGKKRLETLQTNDNVIFFLCKLPQYFLSTFFY
jgi:hypothetical protein